MKQLLNLAAITLLAAACGGTTTPSTSPDASAAPTPSESAQVVAPTILTKENASATVKIGTTVVFSVESPESWTLSASDPNLVELTVGMNDGMMVTNPGALARAAGSVLVTLANAEGDEIIFELVIE